MRNEAQSAALIKCELDKLPEWQRASAIIKSKRRGREDKKDISRGILHIVIPTPPDPTSVKIAKPLNVEEDLVVELDVKAIGAIAGQSTGTERSRAAL